MLAGEVYDACDAELLEDLNAVKVLCQQYNNLLPTDFAARNEMLRNMLGQADEDTFINQPFYCDYGKHIRVGKRFFANFGLTILDEAYGAEAMQYLKELQRQEAKAEQENK